MKKIVILAVLLLFCLLLFSSCQTAEVPSSVASPGSDGNPSSVPSSLFQEEMTPADLFGSAGKLYPLDREYIDAMNQALNASEAERGNIEYEYIQKWKAQMEYYYGILMNALDDEGKATLKASQDSWQAAYDADLALNGAIQAQENIIYDVFENPEYHAYRSRAVALSVKCLSVADDYMPLTPVP